MTPWQIFLPAIVLAAAGTAQAHNPVFGLGPHVLFKDGVEISPEMHTARAGQARDSELGLELTVGISGDWSAGLELPYARNTDSSNKTVNGQGDISVFTKYRFWRDDAPGVQQSASLALRLKTDSGDAGVGTGSTDTLLGLAYGYESRRWYRWAALRYRINGSNSSALKRGDRLLIDLVGGYRARLTHYRQPDTVWLLELNGEIGQRNALNGNALANSGGRQWFISPGIFWTLHNFAIKAGVQIPLVSDLDGGQTETDYRARVVLEWHL